MTLLAIVIMAAVRPAGAQLRPLEPIPWRIFEASNILTAELGGSRMSDQRASLAGTSGTLSELANFSLAWRTGRVAIEASGTGQRRFHEDARFTDPYTDVEPADNARRHDSGDYRISTSVRFTPDRFPVSGVLRFGTRLPTTDNTTGLDRDATDFFATAGLSGERGPVTLQGEAGLGVYSTRETRFEQDDLFLYALRAELRNGWWTPSATAIGQIHGYSHSSIRGVENLGEARFGVRFGRREWIRVEGIKGYSTFSPSAGILITAGIVR